MSNVYFIHKYYVASSGETVEPNKREDFLLASMLMVRMPENLFVLVIHNPIENSNPDDGDESYIAVSEKADPGYDLFRNESTGGFVSVIRFNTLNELENFKEQAFKDLNIENLFKESWEGSFDESFRFLEKMRESPVAESTEKNRNRYN